MPRDGRQATACPHTSSRPGSLQYGGARQLLDLSRHPVSHILVPNGAAADPTPHLERTLEVAPGVEGQLPEPSAALRLPRELLAPCRVLWAAGRKKPAPGLLREGNPGITRLYEEKEGVSDHGGTEA